MGKWINDFHTQEENIQTETSILGQIIIHVLRRALSHVLNTEHITSAAKKHLDQRLNI